MANATQERYGEMDVMMRCLDAAVANLESVVKGLEPKYAELQKWIPAAQADYSALTTGWEQYLSLARSVPVSPAMVQFMTGRDMGLGKGKQPRQATLEDLVDLETARKAGRLAPAALRKFNGRIADLGKVATRLFQDAEDLFRAFERTVDRSVLSHDGESVQLLQDIEAVAKKIETDYQSTLEYSNTSRDVLQASKIASNHTERLLPSIKNRALEMDEMLRYATQSRNALAAETVEFMRNITDITSLSHSVKSQVNAINQEDELATFDYLRLIQQVPFMYASFVSETIKRRGWFDKVKQDSSTLANEMALFQDEETKRRRRWHKSIGNAYGPETPNPDGNVPGLEVNLLGEEEQWPVLTRQHLEEFYDTLQKQGGIDPDLLVDIGKLAADFNNPTKQQSKRLKAFKNGSVHEAALGRSGLLIRGDDDLLRSLQDDKSKVESRLRTAESRVRRLEDLLHRQGQASRQGPGALFQSPSPQLPERNDSTASVKPSRPADDRRRSSEGADTLVQRIQQLEGELDAEKERSAAFKKDLDARDALNDDIQGRMEEANSTKKDLLGNMEALKKEFVEERKSLEDEIKRLQARLEDTEDEIEHVGESRENEKASYDERVHSLEAEVDRLSKQNRDDALKAESETNTLRAEARRQSERAESLESQLRSSQEETKRSAKKLESTGELVQAQLRTLRELHEQISPGSPVPGDVNDLVEAVVHRSTSLLSRVQAVEGDMSLLRSDLDLAQSTVKNLRSEITSANDALSEKEIATMHARDNLEAEKAKVAAVESELADGRQQLNQLRIKISDGESGSESLRKRLEEEEKQVSSLTEELASRQSQVGGLEKELQLFKDKLRDSQLKAAEVASRFDARTERTKDLTRRLYSQNERLFRLLERLGFSVARQGETMTIQKIPRSERLAQISNDPPSDSGPASLRKQANLNSRIPPETADLEWLYWTDAPDTEREAEKYRTFLLNVGHFDADAFSDAVYRRVKDIEHTARKLQRDARAYREKAHALQKEAHDKIAFKHFKEGDLALFLPTRNQTTGAWAAFNVGFPHYFLREQESHRLRNREWLVARISKVQERVVDLSKSLHRAPSGGSRDGRNGSNEVDSLNDDDNDNPFDLSDGLRWYLLDAQEDKPGAPSTPGLGKSTVAANNVEAMADMRGHARTGSKGSVLGGRAGISSGIEGVSKTLSKSLESRRSSTGSRKALPFAIGVGARGRDSVVASETNSVRAAAADSPVAASPPQQQPSSSALAAAQSQARPQTPLAQRSMHADQNQRAGSNGAEGATSTADDPAAQSGRLHNSEVRNMMDSLLGP